MAMPDVPPNPFTARQVEAATATLRERAKVFSYQRGVIMQTTAERFDDLALQRAALAYAAAKLAETGEHGTTDALTLLRQIAEGLA